MCLKRPQQRLVVLAVLALASVTNVREELQLGFCAPPHRVCVHAGHRRPRRRVLEQHRRQQVDGLGLSAQRRVVWLRVQDIAVSLVRLPKGMAPVGEAVVEEAAEREDVHGASLSHGAARTRDELLGRLPAAAAARVVALKAALLRHQLLAEPHVGQLGAPAVGDEHVVGLDVTVHNAARVQRRQARRDLRHDLQPCRVVGETAAAASAAAVRRRGLPAADVGACAAGAAARGPNSAGHVVRKCGAAALERHVDKLEVLLHRKAPHHVGVLIRHDQDLDLLFCQVVKLP
mmetsp:Transcript_19759/g.58607  ORF Transcript_19759/g.58607 Transcript_19759/m.58607 type:complete len:289 (-) Transcript_19759:531-1397(-)